MNPARRLIVPGLALALLGLPPAHAQTPAAPAPPDTTAPALSAAVSRLIAQAEADRKVGKFADALARLDVPPAASPDETKALRLATADVQFWWARSLLTSRPAAALPHYEAALALNRALSPFQAACDLNEIGLVYERTGRPDKAVNALNEALALFRQTDDRNKNGEANTLLNLGGASIDMGQYETGLGFLQQALPLFKQASDDRGRANTLNGLGIAYTELRQYSRAEGFFQMALPLMRQTGNAVGEAAVLGGLGNCSFRLGQYSKAISLQRQALLLVERFHDERGKAKVLNNIGLAYNGLGQHQTALGLYGQALSLYRQTGDRHGEAVALGNMGTAYSGLAQYGKAAGFFQQALPLFRQTRDKPGEALAIRNLSLVQKRLKGR